MNINYQLNVNELDGNFIKSLKKLFKDKEINIFVVETSDLQYLKQAPNMIDSILEGIKEDVSQCSTLKDIDWE